jgi:hypothetical protein
MSFLTAEYEKLVHLMARALSRTNGQVEAAETFAETVLGHARQIAEEDVAKVEKVVEPIDEPAALPPGDEQPAA